MTKVFPSRNAFINAFITSTLTHACTVTCLKDFLPGDLLFVNQNGEKNPIEAHVCNCDSALVTYCNVQMQA